jgi:RNA exonuclease 4
MSSSSRSSSSGGGGGIAKTSSSSNWQALKQKLSATQAQTLKKQKQNKKISGSEAVGSGSTDKGNNKRKLNNGDNGSSHEENQFKRRREIQASLEKAQTSKSEAVAAAAEAAAADAKKAKLKWKDDRYIGLDCEMVGIGKMGKKSSLARCSIVNYSGDVIYDKFVRSNDYVVDFRTKYSGIRKKDLRKGNAIPLEQCQKEVAAILKGKILVGHALKNDLLALMLKHNRGQIRDTARYRPYMRPHGRKGGKFKPRKLKELCKQFLKITIQEGEHDSGTKERKKETL